ncbi:MAG: histone deacetylase, partial [Aquificaceae bacterium]|nr:histone deacetylase [Aquificaceae bacterium]
IKQGIEKTVMKKITTLRPRRASAQEVSLNHEPTYIQEVADFCKAGGGRMDPDTYLTTRSYDVALHAVGAILEGIDMQLNGEYEAAFCAVRPPGHHAERAKAMGFCIFNNIAVGAWYLLSKDIKRVFIIDFDAHHGNGTQKSFYEEDRVFFFSSHQYPFYPGTGGPEERGSGRGYGFTHNEPLPAGAGDKEILQIYKEVLPEKISFFKPEFILVSAGYDIHKSDPLTYLNVSTEGIREIVKSILTEAKNLSVPVLFSLEGGYNLSALEECVAISIQEMVNA